VTVPLGLDPRGSLAARDGGGRYAIRVGDLTIAVDATAAALTLRISTATRAFLTDARVADLTLAVSLEKLESDLRGELLFDSGATWRLYAVDDRYVFRFVNPIFGATPYKEARIEHDFGRGEIVLHPDAFDCDQPVDAMEFPLDELLFIRLLTSRGGIELHACGVVDPSGNGLIFAGHSGDGKTTTARLWEAVPGATVLSDDRIIVRRGGDGSWWMYGTPWHGEAELAVNARAPLTGVMLLARGESNALLPAEPMAAASGLLARSFVPYYDANLMASAVELLGKLTGEVPTFRFPFVPAPETVRFVLDRLSEKGS